MKRMECWTCLFALLAATSALAGELRPGDEAPPISVTRWVKGEAFDLAAVKGKNTVVVEFWATWCGPCIASMPHLTKLQKDFADKGVLVVSVTRPDPNNSLEKVEKFVAEKGDVMGYRVAFDGDAKTYDAYMKASGSRGIPTAFVVDKSGKLAWFGHPMRMDGPLAEIVEGTFDADMAGVIRDLESNVNRLMAGGKTERALQVMEALAVLEPAGSWRARLHLQRISLHLKAKELEKASEAAVKAVEQLDDPSYLATIGNMALRQEGMPQGTDLAVRAARKAIDKDPANSGARLLLVQALLKKGSREDAVSECKKIVESARDNALALNDAAWTLLTEGEFPAPVIELALRASERCNEITGGKNWMYLDTLALAKFKTGAKEEALELQRKAVALGEQAKAPAAALKEARGRLEEFEKAIKKEAIRV
jgi:thiol-disulfide isomerase/thioredoxin